MQEKDSVLSDTMESRFIHLSDLLYVPVHAVSLSNMRLSSNILELLENASEITQEDDETVYDLKTINIAYNQIKTIEEDLSREMEKIELKLPLLSVIPLTSLQVQKADIDFDTEIGSLHKDPATGDYELDARVSAERPRYSDHFPKIKFQMEVRTAAPPEGISRLLDTLNANPIPKTLFSQPVDGAGQSLEGPARERALRRKKRRAQKGALEKLLHTLDRLAREQKKRLTLLLQQEGLLSSGEDGWAAVHESTLPESILSDEAKQMIQELSDLESRQDTLREKMNTLFREIVMEEAEVWEGV